MTLEVAISALRTRWGSAIDATLAAELQGSDRSAVSRIALSGSSAPVETAIVKAYEGDGTTWQNEAAGAAYFGRVGGGLTPDLLAFDGSRRVVVLTDLGDHPQLSDVLLGDDADVAERALLDWADSLGRLLARTIGDRAAYERTRAELGLDALESLREARFHSCCSELPAVAESRLGVTAPAGVAEELADAVRIFDDTELEIVTPADMCPDNNLLTPDGIRFLDLEFAGCSPLFLEAAYTRMPFPSCWCRMDTPIGLLDKVEDALRRPLVAAKPELGDDAVWSAGMARACALWNVMRIYDVLTRSAEDAGFEPWDRNGVLIPTFDAGSLQALSRAPETIGAELPACTKLMTDIYARSVDEFGEPVVPVYPAFSTKG